MRIWRNRQTRMVQVHVSIALMQVQLLLSAPERVFITVLCYGHSFFLFAVSCAKRADTTAFSYERQTEILTLFDASLRSEAEHVTDISENHRVLI